MEHHYMSRRVSMDTFNRNFYNSNFVMTPEEAQRTQKPYRYGMILLCFGALINWIGLAENYTDPFRYAGVACIIGGAFLICTAMCCWLHVPNRSAVGVSETDVDNDAIHVITVADPVTTEKPPEYDTVVILDPPCYDDAIKLNPANLLKTKQYQDVSLPNYDDLGVNEPYLANQNQDNVYVEQQQALQHQWTISTTTTNNNNNQINNINVNSNQTNDSQNVTNSCSDNAFTVITIQTAPNSSNEQQQSHQQHSITRKSNEFDSVASESIAMS